MPEDRLSSEGQDLGFAEAEMLALDVFRRLRQVGGKPDLQLVLLGVGNRDDWASMPLFRLSQQHGSLSQRVPNHDKDPWPSSERPPSQVERPADEAFSAPGRRVCTCRFDPLLWVRVEAARVWDMALLSSLPNLFPVLYVWATVATSAWLFMATAKQ